YEVYRGTSPGGEKVKIGDSGVKTGYTDSTAGSSGTFYYTVRAQNSQGFGPQSNEVAPPVVALPPPETACTAPGLTKLTDASGDGIIAGSDLKSLQIAQPYQTTGVNWLTFTINTDPGQAVQPLGSAWFVSMKKVNGATTTYKGVRMVWNGATPTFESYTPSPNSSGTVDGRFVAAGSQKPAASGSYAPPYDKIVITVNAADLGLSDGSLINGFVSGVSQPANPTNTGANASTLYDQMPNSLAYTGGYTVDSQACRPNTPPTAAMSAVPTSGTAPLLVSFDGSASTDSDTATPADTIASYTFDFGDGTSSGAQSSPSVSHTYATGGSYTASLTVTDSRGAVSTNSAQATIAAAPPQPDLDVTNLVPSNNQAKQGDKITFTATIKNVGQGSADVSNTEFILDGTTVLGTPNTSSLAPGSETLVSVQWQTTSRTPKGNHKVVATADINKAVAESDEGNNAMEITIFLQGNKTR
ncbi:MAG: PKD domain-containing protein, partial [Pyrinomonadaceae bacterium]|nr:PKD domain-containing protein [Pyrinomonadaceae bacterium]